MCNDKKMQMHAILGLVLSFFFHEKSNAHVVSYTHCANDDLQQLADQDLGEPYQSISFPFLLLSTLPSSLPISLRFPVPSAAKRSGECCTSSSMVQDSGRSPGGQAFLCIQRKKSGVSRQQFDSRFTIAMCWCIVLLNFNKSLNARLNYIHGLKYGMSRQRTYRRLCRLYVLWYRYIYEYR